MKFILSALCCFYVFICMHSVQAISCPPGQIPNKQNPKQCDACPSNQISAGKICRPCPYTGQVITNNVCQCLKGQSIRYANGRFGCSSCTITQTIARDGSCVNCTATGQVVYNNECSCPSGRIVVNNACTACPSNQITTDGKTCKACPSVQIARNNECICPISGQQLVNNQCGCYPGMTVSNNRCVCLPGLVVGAYGCDCPEGTEMNGSTCVPVKNPRNVGAPCSLDSFCSSKHVKNSGGQIVWAENGCTCNPKDLANPKSAKICSYRVDGLSFNGGQGSFMSPC